MGELKRKAINGVVWSAIDGLSNQGITFLVGIVLARLLTPREYGLIGYIMILIAIMNSIVNSGFSNALIRKHDIKDIDYSTTFIFNFVVSIGIFLLLQILAGPISLFLNEPQLEILIRVMAIIVIINACAIIQKTRLTRNIDFKLQTKISIISSVSSGLVGISMASAKCGVWSLVGQQLCYQISNTLCLWVFNKWIPELKFSRQSFNELFGFGWKLMISSLIDVIWKEVYQLVIGKFYTTATLGQFTRGKQFSDLLSVNFTAVIQRVTYPVLSTIQDDKRRLKESYRRIIKLTMFISFIALFGLAAISKPLIVTLIGNQWIEGAKYLQILCFSACLYPLHAINLNMLQVLGRSDLFLKLEIIKKIIGVGPIVIGILVNIEWMLWSSVISGIIALYLNSYYSSSFIGYSFLSQIKDILPSMLLAVVIMAVVYPITFCNLPSVIILGMQLVLGAALLVFFGEFLRFPEYYEVKNILSHYIRIIVNKNSYVRK